MPWCKALVRRTNLETPDEGGRHSQLQRANLREHIFTHGFGGCDRSQDEGAAASSRVCL